MGYSGFLEFYLNKKDIAHMPLADLRELCNELLEWVLFHDDLSLLNTFLWQVTSFRGPKGEELRVTVQPRSILRLLKENRHNLVEVLMDAEERIYMKRLFPLQKANVDGEFFVSLLEKAKRRMDDINLKRLEK